MNVYFWLFALCAFFSMPLSVQLSVRAGGGIRYRIRLGLAGVALAQKTEAEEKSEEKQVVQEAAKAFFRLNGKMLWRLWNEGHMARAARGIRLDDLQIRVHLSFEDAALTALGFAALRTLVQILLSCLPKPLPLRGRVEMDYSAQGTWASIRCIFSARLGSLLAATLRLAAAFLSVRAGLKKTEEEPYAAASH